MMALCWILPGCEIDNCPPNAMAYAKFALVDQVNRPIKLTQPLSVIGEIITDVAVKDTADDGSISDIIVKDSVVRDTLINMESDVSEFKIPLSFLEKTRIILSMNNGEISDAIDITHRNIPYFYNLDCGTMMFYEVTNVTCTTLALDSISITNPNIDNHEKENFKIHFTLTDPE